MSLGNITMVNFAIFRWFFLTFYYTEVDTCSDHNQFMLHMHTFVMRTNLSDRVITITLLNILQTYHFHNHIICIPFAKVLRSSLWQTVCIVLLEFILCSLIWHIIFQVSLFSSSCFFDHFIWISDTCSAPHTPHFMHPSLHSALMSLHNTKHTSAVKLHDNKAMNNESFFFIWLHSYSINFWK